MLRKIECLLINSLWFLLCLPKYMAFQRSIKDVKKTQEELLLRIIHKNSNTTFGREHNFSDISSINDFRKKIKATSYDFYRKYIESILEGKENILSRDRVKSLIPSSGTTAPSKYIPFTEGLSKDFDSGISPWIYDLFSMRKNLLLGSSYWSISPVTKKEKELNDARVGFNDDSEYLGDLKKYLLNRIFSVPVEVSRIENMEAFRYATLLFLLKDKNLFLISIWNPTFLSLLLRPLLDWKNMFVEDIHNGTIHPRMELNSEVRHMLERRLSKDKKRAKELDDLFKDWDDKRYPIYEKIWPNLKVISCWADGHAKNHLKDIKLLFPNVEIQPKGLLATEGIVSFPLIDENGCALSINSHFFEFLPVDNNENEPILAHQVQKDKQYSVLITTSGGLYRYKLNDTVEVVGFKKQCPLIRFIGKDDNVVDLFGEKINERHISNIMEETIKKSGLKTSFLLMAPEKSEKESEYFYTTFIQLDGGNGNGRKLLRDLSCLVEEKILENFHYKHCRNLGQLKESRFYIIDQDEVPEDVYISQCLSSDQKLGNIKPSLLSKKIGWSGTFNGEFV